jgi:hypothetical protein
MKVKQNVRLALFLIQNGIETHGGLKESVLPPLPQQRNEVNDLLHASAG